MKKSTYEEKGAKRAFILATFYKEKTKTEKD